MKKHIVIAAGLAVLSTSAFATKARMEALGQGSERGSFFIQDTRNVFRNAANVNDMTNYIVTEWGTSPAGANPNAEGGIFRSAGSLNYGIYLGSEIDNQDRVLDTDDSGIDDISFMDQSNRLQVFVGGDAGIKWGATAYYASNKNEQGAFETKNSALGLGVGVVSGPIDGYVNLLLSDKSDGSSITGLGNDAGEVAAANDKWEADLGMNVGVGYTWMNYKFFAEYTKGGAEATIAGAKAEEESTDIIVGVGHTHEVSASSRVFTSLQYENSKDEVKSGGTTAETKSQSLPLTIGFETDATSWLALRGSISQNVVIGSDEVAGKKASQQNSTRVNTGATLNFGKLKVDGMIGTTTAGNLSTDELLARVGLHYWF